MDRLLSVPKYEFLATIRTVPRECSPECNNWLCEHFELPNVHFWQLEVEDGGGSGTRTKRLFGWRNSNFPGTEIEITIFETVNFKKGVFAKTLTHNRVYSTSESDWIYRKVDFQREPRRHFQWTERPDIRDSRVSAVLLWMSEVRLLRLIPCRTPRRRWCQHAIRRSATRPSSVPRSPATKTMRINAGNCSKKKEIYQIWKSFA